MIRGRFGDTVIFVSNVDKDGVQHFDRLRKGESDTEVTKEASRRRRVVVVEDPSDPLYFLQVRDRRRHFSLRVHFDRQMPSICLMF